jgi:tRNA-Thr(GGU) m(6)t(6)A37 methyltransferase TsaA
MKKTLLIDTITGISADRFAAALIGLGVPEQIMMQTIKRAAEDLGMLDAHTHLEFLPDEVLAHRLHLSSLEEQEPVPWEETPAILEKALSRAEVEDAYADFAQRALSILRATKTNTASLSPEQTVSLPIIGTAHTPYKHKAPYQPQPENVSDGEFYIQVESQYAAATHGLNTFSHIFVLSYLDRSLEPETTVRPPWKDDDKRYGTFATRSPNRPSPIGLTRVRLHRVEGKRIYTGPLDLFDGTPVLDIKPFIQTLDGMSNEEDAGNDGWLEGSDHLELHRLGIPHAHPGGSGTLDQPQILIALLTGIAYGLQHLSVDCGSAVCTSPVNTGMAHDLELTTQAIFTQYKIPSQAGIVSGELVTSDGAAILAALSPKFIAAEDMPSGDKRISYGLGGQNLDSAPALGALSMLLIDQPTLE